MWNFESAPELDAALDTEQDGDTPDLLSAPPDSAIFESIDGELRPSAASPGWLNRLKAFDGNAETITDYFPYLECFLPEATRFWDQGRDGQHVSDFWTQTGDAGCKVHLLAYALARKGRRLLLIRSAEGLYRERERVQRCAHELVIQWKRVARRQRGLDERANSLKASNTRLPAMADC